VYNAWFLWPLESPTRTESTLVHPFCRAHEHDRQTDTRTTLLYLQQQTASSCCYDAAQEFNILIVNRVNMIYAHHPTTFHGNRSNCCW